MNGPIYDRAAHFKQLYERNLLAGMTERGAKLAAEAEAKSPEEVRQILEEEHQWMLGVAQRARRLWVAPP